MKQPHVFTPLEYVEPTQEANSWAGGPVAYVSIVSIASNQDAAEEAAALLQVEDIGSTKFV